MEGKRAVIYLVVIGLGLVVGLQGQSIYDNLTSELSTEQPDTADIRGELVSEDPKLQSFNSSINNTSFYTHFRQVPKKFADQKYGPWRAIPWRYVPPSALKDVNKSKLIISAGENEGNLYQLINLPDRDNLNIVLEARDASEMIGANYRGCQKSVGFISLFRWEGSIPPANISNNNLNQSSKIRKDKVFSTNTSELVLEIPERFEGDKVAFFGGVSPREPDCIDAKVHHLAVEKLYISSF